MKTARPKSWTRRRFLSAAATLAATSAAHGQSPAPKPSLSLELGVTTGSFVRHLSEQAQPGKLRLLDFPRLLRDELDMRVIDLMTATLPSLESAYLEQLRAAADRAGCQLTNLKMNQQGLNLGSEQASERQHAMEEYKQTIRAAAQLGVRWVRPLPGSPRPDLRILADSYRQLIDFAKPLGISLLIENFGWLASDPSAIPDLIAAVGPGLAAQPDTGNWAGNEVRYQGLAKAFPLAASCDFKALALGPRGEHAAYDLQKCFDIGWDTGFRGPWCFEHQHADLATLYRDLALLRDQLRGWIAARSK